MRWLALCLLASPLAAQDIDRTAPFEVQEIAPDGRALVHSGGLSYLCDMARASVEGAVQYRLEACAPIVMGPVAFPQALLPPTAAQAARIAQMMPPTAFQAALIDLIVARGCVLDFSDYAAQEQALIEGMREQLQIDAASAGAVEDILRTRIGETFTMLEDRFEIDDAAQTATLLSCD